MTTSNKNKAISLQVKEILAQDGDLLRNIIREVIQEFLEAETDEALGASKSEHSETRLGYRSGYYQRTLLNRVGKIELRVPRDRDGRFSTEIFDRYQRSEKALVIVIAEMYVQGVSTRDVSEIAEKLLGDAISASSVSRLNKSLDQIVDSFANRKLECEYPYLILDARYEKVRENGVVSSKAILVAIGVSWEGKREVLAVEIANRESANSWKEFISKLKAPGLNGVQLVISDAHIGLQTAITAFEYMRSVPMCMVPDNPKPIVIKASKLDPVFNQSYLEWARHYDVTIIPARPRKRRDKAAARRGSPGPHRHPSRRIERSTDSTLTSGEEDPRREVSISSRRHKCGRARRR